MRDRSEDAQSAEELQLQEYLFDLNGFLMVEDVLGAQEVAAFKQSVDQRLEAEGEVFGDHMVHFGAAPSGSGFLEWGDPFCALLTHPRIMPILRFRIGDCFRLDRIYGICMHQGMSRGELHSDYGTSAPLGRASPGKYFPFRKNQIAEGFVVVAFNLTDAGPDHGGFCCIPGSHKSHFQLPQRIADSPETCPFVVVPEVPAGSAVLFTEALTHGTTAWHGPCERCSLLYKYCVSHISWMASWVTPPATELTEPQKILFREPADPHRHFPPLFQETERPLERGYN